MKKDSMREKTKGAKRSHTYVKIAAVIKIKYKLITSSVMLIEVISVFLKQN